MVKRIYVVAVVWSCNEQRRLTVSQRFATSEDEAVGGVLREWGEQMPSSAGWKSGPRVVSVVPDAWVAKAAIGLVGSIAPNGVPNP